MNWCIKVLILIFQNVILKKDPLQPPRMYWFLPAAAMNDASNNNTQLFTGSSGSSVRDDYIYKPNFSPQSASEKPFMLLEAVFINQCRSLWCCLLTLCHCSVIRKHSPVSQVDRPAVALQILLTSFSRASCHTPCGGFLDLTSQVAACVSFSHTWQAGCGL